MKSILFVDFDGTLCFDRFWSSLGSESQAKIQEIIFKSQKMGRDWMTGKYTSEDINKMLSVELGCNYEELWATFVGDCKKMRVSIDDLKKISSLRDRYIAVLATDNMDCFDRFTSPARELDKYFDLIVNSFNEGRLKGDDGGLFFQNTAQKLGNSLSDAVLIDNSVNCNKLFDSLGGRACLVTPTEPLDYWLDRV